MDGAVIAESNTICRFIAKKVGLYGEDPLEQAQVDMVIDNISDLTGSRLKESTPKNMTVELVKHCPHMMLILDKNTANIYFTDYMRAAYPKNNDEMEKVVKAINKEKIPNFVRRAEKLLQSRGGKHFAGDKVMLNEQTIIKKPKEKKKLISIFLGFTALLG